MQNFNPLKKGRQMVVKTRAMPAPSEGISIILVEPPSKKRFLKKRKCRCSSNILQRSGMVYFRFIRIIQILVLYCQKYSECFSSSDLLE